MSHSNRPQPLGALLESVIDRMGFRTKIDEVRTIEGWAAVAGPQVNAVTETVWLERKKLFVKITSATWRQELHLERSAWKQKLNRHLGTNMVKEIVFR